jgi:hypothetical protein
MAQAVTFLVPVVQVPPRGMWRQPGLARWAPLESWLGQPMAANEAPDALVLRYLAAFGPASAADVRAWSGLPGAAEVLDRLRPGLRAYLDDTGRELLDVPDGLLADPETPAPVRFLPVYDNVTLAHADRSRIVDEDHRRRILQLDMISFGSILVDGFGRAIWRLERAKSGGPAVLDIQLMEEIPAADLDAIGAEADRFLTFLEPTTTDRSVRLGRLSTA